EDGIRDLIVTGVQTCALPISEGHLLIRLHRAGMDGRRADGAVRAGRKNGRTHHPPDLRHESLAVGLKFFAGKSHGDRSPAVAVRSEERRVGKECRTRWGLETW